MTTLLPTLNTFAPTPFEALESYLKLVMEKIQALSMVIANEDGLVVAGAGDRALQDELAAVAVVPKAQARFSGKFHHEVLSIDGTTLHVSTHGPKAPPLAELPAKVRQILG